MIRINLSVDLDESDGRITAGHVGLAIFDAAANAFDHLINKETLPPLDELIELENIEVANVSRIQLWRSE